MALLEVRNITRRFGGLVAVNDVSLEVNQGEILGLIGPNGSGKTTLFNLITGFLSPTKGEILFKGRNITGLKPHEIAQRGIVRSWQETALLFSSMTVLENVIIGHHVTSTAGFWRSVVNTAFARKEEEDTNKKALELLEFLGLASSKNALTKNLPHGHQRAVGIAIALATDPQLLLLDEPVTGMRAEETISMMEKIRKTRERGVTLVVIEHDMRVVMRICERIAVLNFGRKIAEGTPEEIRENKEVMEAYLGVERREEGDAA